MPLSQRPLAVAAAVALPSLVACAGAKPALDGDGSNAAETNAATSSTLGASSAPTPPPRTPSTEITQKLPPFGSADRPRPSGAGSNLRVLPWAGFQAALSYSFDDGQPSQIQHYDALQAMGVPMTFYVSTKENWQAGYDAAWSRAARDGHELGNHTVNHCYANGGGMNGAACQGWLGADEEVAQCSTYIETRLGQNGVWTMAYPFGDAAWRPSAEKRFFLARGVRGGTVRASDTVDFFDLPVLNIAGGESEQQLRGDVDRTRAANAWGIFLVHTLLPTPDNWYAGVDIDALTGSMGHAKELGDIWVDTVANVGAYLAGHQALALATPHGSLERTWNWTLPNFFPRGRALRVVVDGGTLTQLGKALTWDPHGYYEVALDAQTLTWSP
jgi:peptidoglycan/xylan/chitin deacetylase (PgdA/CDA1 family)